MSESTFHALLAESDAEGRVTASVRQLGLEYLVPDELADGQVLVRVEHSSLNYKDGMAVRGLPGIVRNYPIIPGIDVVGIVERSADPRWSPGERLVLNGAGLGESRNGGFAEYAVVPGASAVPVPAGLSAWSAAAIGTAGDTAALSVLALQGAGVTPDSGDIVVTGASGGVGSVAVTLLARSGYRVIASTGRIEQHGELLRSLGAAEIIDRAEIAEAGRPLEKARFAGAIDSVGGATLARLLASTSYGGAVTCCGLVQDAALPTTVMPFILRGVSLHGINSVDAPLDHRLAAWKLLGDTLDDELLRTLAHEIGLAEVPAAAEAILAGRVHGRTVVTP